MNKKEIGQLLTLAALVDNRTVTAEACLMWHEIIGHLQYQQAVDAMQEHYRETTDWLMPAHVIQRVRAAHRAGTPADHERRSPGRLRGAQVDGGRDVPEMHSKERDMSETTVHEIRRRP